MLNLTCSSIHSPHVPGLGNGTLADTKPRHCCRGWGLLSTWEAQRHLFGPIQDRDALLPDRDNNRPLPIGSTSPYAMVPCSNGVRWLSTSDGSPDRQRLPISRVIEIQRSEQTGAPPDPHKFHTGLRAVDRDTTPRLMMVGLRCKLLCVLPLDPSFLLLPYSAAWVCLTEKLHGSIDSTISDPLLVFSPEDLETAVGSGFVGYTHARPTEISFPRHVDPSSGGERAESFPVI
jgi:hypothetical protein